MVIQRFWALKVYPLKGYTKQKKPGHRLTAVISVSDDTVRLQREILVEPPVRLLADVAQDFGVATCDYRTNTRINKP